MAAHFFVVYSVLDVNELNLELVNTQILEILETHYL